MRFLTQEETNAQNLQTGFLSAPLPGCSCVTKWIQVIYGKKLFSGLLRTDMSSNLSGSVFEFFVLCGAEN